MTPLRRWRTPTRTDAAGSLAVEDRCTTRDYTCGSSAILTFASLRRGLLPLLLFRVLRSDDLTGLPPGPARLQMSQWADEDHQSESFQLPALSPTV